MAIEKQPRIHLKQVVEAFSPQDRKDDDAAQSRFDKLLFEYVLKYPEKLRKWLDAGKHDD